MIESVITGIVAALGFVLTVAICMTIFLRFSKNRVRWSSGQLLSAFQAYAHQRQSLGLDTREVDYIIECLSQNKFPDEISSYVILTQRTLLVSGYDSGLMWSITYYPVIVS